MPQMTAPHADLSRIRDALLEGDNFLLTSHARPDGDSLGSQLALAEALRQIGKRVRVVNCDAAPALYAFMPDLSSIEVVDSVADPFDAVVVLSGDADVSTAWLAAAAPLLLDASGGRGIEGVACQRL